MFVHQRGQFFLVKQMYLWGPIQTCHLEIRVGSSGTFQAIMHGQQNNQSASTWHGYLEGTHNEDYWPFQLRLMKLLVIYAGIELVVLVKCALLYPSGQLLNPILNRNHQSRPAQIRQGLCSIGKMLVCGKIKPVHISCKIWNSGDRTSLARLTNHPVHGHLFLLWSSSRARALILSLSSFACLAASLLLLKFIASACGPKSCAWEKCNSLKSNPSWISLNLYQEKRLLATKVCATYIFISCWYTIIFYISGIMCCSPSSMIMTQSWVSSRLPQATRIKCFVELDR